MIYKLIKKFIHPIFLIIICAILFIPSKNLLGQDDCMECHGETDLTKLDAHDREISLFVDLAKYETSIHGEFDCVDCHQDAEEIPHEETLQKVDCGMCHEEAFEAHVASVHGQSIEQGSEEAAGCVDCHSRHEILAVDNPASRVYPLNLAATCAICHADPKITKKYDIPISDPLSAYNKSVHGIALMSEENFDAATCISCHGLHGIRSMNDPQSPIHWQNVSETCGACHGEEYEQYAESVHGKAVAKGVRDAPVCTDCHGEHQVQSPADPQSPIHPLRVSAITCERCHSSELIVERYGIAPSRVATFEESYHGLAIKGGSLAAANCASCHGIHNILASSDPNSMIFPANLKTTCGSCHHGATKNLWEGPVHLTTSTIPGRVVQTVRSLYIGLIVVVILIMLLHNGADFVRRTKIKVRQRDSV